jgi:electron transfer flavoprotein alpha subunit
MSTILTIAEVKEGIFRKSSLEVISQARIIADQKQAKIVVLAIGGEIKDQPAGLGEYGADHVLLAEDAKLATYNPDFYKTVVLTAVEKTGAEMILLSATTLGQDLAPRIAAKLNAVLASDCTGLTIANGTLEVDRPLYAGKVTAKVLLSGQIQMASLRPNVFNASKNRAGQTATVEKIALPTLSSGVSLKEFRRTGGNKMDVSDAEIIVTGGRGVRSADNFKVLEELAASLNAAVGATRAVVDSGWRLHEDQIGQTGKVVSPNLYVMCGASGSIQHWAGMSGSRCIVAINKDANAPIFQRADYGIVGDLFEIVPALTTEIKKFRG